MASSGKQPLRFAQGRRARDNGSAVTFGRAVWIIERFCSPGLAPWASFFRPSGTFVRRFGNCLQEQEKCSSSIGMCNTKPNANARKPPSLVSFRESGERERNTEPTLQG